MYILRQKVLLKIFRQSFKPVYILSRQGFLKSFYAFGLTIFFVTKRLRMNDIIFKYERSSHFPSYIYNLLYFQLVLSLNLIHNILNFQQNKKLKLPMLFNKKKYDKEHKKKLILFHTFFP